MTKERLLVSIQTVEENIRILETETHEDAGHLLQLEHERHVLELLQAEAEGRLIVLPCKVGDTVYFRTYAKNATVDLGVMPHRITGYRLGMVTESEAVLPDYEFGRTVFLSREEAERALGEGE